MTYPIYCVNSFEIIFFELALEILECSSNTDVEMVRRCDSEKIKLFKRNVRNPGEQCGQSARWSCAKGLCFLVLLCSSAVFFLFGGHRLNVVHDLLLHSQNPLLGPPLHKTSRIPCNNRREYPNQPVTHLPVLLLQAVYVLL